MKALCGVQANVYASEMKVEMGEHGGEAGWVWGRKINPSMTALDGWSPGRRDIVMKTLMN